MRKAYRIIFSIILSGAFAAGGFGEIKTAKPAAPPPKPNNDSGKHMTLKSGGKSFAVQLYDCASVKALEKLLPLDMEMIELNGNEKYHRLSAQLPVSPEMPGKIRAGDLMLYGSDYLVIFYKTFSPSYSYTKLGHIEDASGLLEALGSGNTRVKLSLQKKE